MEWAERLCGPFSPVLCLVLSVHGWGYEGVRHGSGPEARHSVARVSPTSYPTLANALGSVRHGRGLGEEWA